MSDLKTGKKIDYDFIYEVDSNKLISEKNNLFGVIDFYGKILIPNEYKEISENIDKTFIGMKKNKYSIYSFPSNMRLSKEFDYIQSIDKNIYKAGNNEIGKYAFLSSKVSTIEKYDEILKVKDSFYIGILKDYVEILDEYKGVVAKITKEEFDEKYKLIKR